MRLSKIKLSGFKSFVDSTTISFPSNLMGIVGPNGCGKSNVIDAIRWVLGESSAKTLRGDSMADVIFNGSSGRKPVGQASIELFFDNGDGTITGAYAGYSEVSVRRVVSRDGTSQYFLNNSRCRRKDITHILLGTGLGSHGYSIIEQGMISRLVEAKPEDLRAFLEEAAGISKYKERRRETEHRIRHTRDNLERLADLREELDKQLQHLQRQARAAERYKSLKSEERRASAELLLLRLRDCNRKLTGEQEALQERQLELDRAVTEQGAVDSEIEKLRVQLTERNDDFATVQGTYYRVGAEIARLEQSIQHRKSTIQTRETDLATVDQQLAEISGHLNSDTLELAELEQVLKRLNPELDAATTRLRQAEEKQEAAEAAAEDHRNRLERLTQDIGNCERVAQVEGTRVEQLIARRRRLERDRDEQTTAREALDFAELERSVDELVAREERDRNVWQEASRGLEALWDEIREQRSSESQMSAALDKRRDVLQQDRGRLSSLEALQEAAFGKVSPQLSAWLQKHGLADASRLAEVLEVEGGWERAVETALAGYLNAIRVDNVDRLATELESVSGDGLALIESGEETREGGGIETNLVALASKVAGPADARLLLAGYFAADSLAFAVANRGRLNGNQHFVTTDGVLVGKHAIRSHRSDDPQLGVLARNDEIEALRSDIATTTSATDTLTDQLATCRSRLDELETLRASRQAECNERQEAFADSRAKLESSRARLDEARQRASDIDAALNASQEEQTSIDQEIDNARATLDSASQQREHLLADRRSLEGQRAQLVEQQRSARGSADSAREQVKQIAIQVEARRSSRESANAALERVRSQLQHLERQHDQLKAQIAEASGPLAGEAELLAAQLDERLMTEEQLAAARRAVEDAETDVRGAESRRTERQQAVQDARDAADNVRLAVREAQVRADTVREQLQSTGFDQAELEGELDADATISAWTEKLESIERRLQRIGNVNLTAIDEFETQSERKQYLDKQFADLTSALETLEAAIRKIDRETRARFKETFDKANSGLNRLFPRLFGGGSAYLELDSDDLLSAGVTVMARPPGKRISTIHLMSGGEKALAAVALVFSIFELNPAPFCLLDEVDAPLDDANVGRFTEIVREMSEHVQFVLITHNKTTMEAMHQLSGVTMHEPGVSRLVAVDIDEAVQLAAM